MTQQLAIK